MHTEVEALLVGLATEFTHTYTHTHAHTHIHTQTGGGASGRPGN